MRRKKIWKHHWETELPRGQALVLHNFKQRFSLFPLKFTGGSFRASWKWHRVAELFWKSMT